MHTVELLDAALAVAKRLGIEIRQDWLDGAGGVCVLKGRTCLFLDLAETPQEHLELAIEALCGRPDLATLALPAELAQLLAVRKSA